MANLTRWSKPIPPRWLGNSEDKQPFAMRYKRLTRGELRALGEALQAAPAEATPEQLAEVYGPYVQGPLAADGGPVALTIDELAIPSGDLAGLFRACADELGAKDSLINEITDTLLAAVNGLKGSAAGESSGSRGGASTTRADPSEAALPVPTAAA